MYFKRNLTKKKIVSLILLSALIFTSFASLYNHDSTGDSIHGFYSESQFLSPSSIGSNPLLSIGSPYTLSGINTPNAMAYDPNNGYTYVADYSTDSVSVLDGTNSIATYALQEGYDANGITYNSYYNLIYVSMYSSTSGDVAVMTPTGTVVSYLYLGNAAGAAGIASLPNGYTLVSLSLSNYVDVIKDTSNLTDIKVPKGPEWIEYDSENGYAYVISTDQNPATVSIISTSSNSAVGSVSAPVGTLLYQNGMIYDFGLNSLSAISGESTAIPPDVSGEDEPVTSYPYAAAAGPGNDAFIAMNGTNSIDVVGLAGSSSYSTGTVSDPGVSPQGILYNPVTDYLYVANFKSDTVDVYSVKALYQVTFTESGLPYETQWSVTIDGLTNSTTSDTVSFYLADGSYTYEPDTPINEGGLQFQTSSSGTVNVNGPTGVQIDYQQTEYTTTFVESGLNSGTSWSVSFDGSTESSTGSTISFTSTAGTYSYTVYPPTGYTANPESSTITVSSSSEIGITFTYTATTAYTLTFSESGLPSGTIWYVNVLGVSNYSISQPSISLSLDSGDYSYKLYSPGYTPFPASGSIDLTSDNTVDIQFDRKSIPVYNQTFKETGLQPDDRWYVQITGGNNFSSVSSTLNVSLQSGTYRYTVYSEGFTPSIQSGIFSLPSSTDIEITFSPVILKSENVTFNENGLSQGYEWYVNINGRNYSSLGNNLTAELPQGSFAYTVYSFGYSPNPGSGTIAVLNSPVSVTIEFTFVSFSKNESMTVSYDGNLYNFSADINYKYFGSPNTSMTQADLFKKYIGLSLTYENVYIRNVSIISQSDGAVINGAQARNILDSILVWSQLNYDSLQNSFGTNSQFYSNLQTLINGQWSDTVGSILPEILNFAIVAGQIGTIASEAGSGDISSLTSLAGPIYSILNGVKVASEEYSQQTAQTMLQTLESYNIVSGATFNTTTALSNLSHLSSADFSQLLSSLYSDTSPSSSISGNTALNDVTNAFGDFLQYSPFYGISPSYSIATVVSDASSLIHNADESSASSAAGDVGSDIASSIMDQYFAGLQSSDVSTTQEISGDVNTADSQFSLQLGPGIVLGIANALNQNFLVPQGQLLASITGSQQTLTDFYNAINSLIPDMNGETPDLSSAMATAYIAQMIKTTWLQWYSIASQLNGRDYSPPAEQSQWNTIIQYLSGNQYNATMFLRTLDLLAGNILNNNTEPIYTNQVNNFYKERTSRLTLDEFSVDNVIKPSQLSTIADAVYNYLDDAWSNVTSYASKLLSNLTKLGAYIVNGVETFSSDAYSELSDFSSGAISFFSDIGDGVSAGWKWLVNLFITDETYIQSNSVGSSIGNEWIEVRNGSNLYEYSNGVILSSNLWTYAVVSGSGGLIVTNISAGQNISIEVGSSAAISPMPFASESNNTIHHSYTQEPDIAYDYSSSSLNGSEQFTAIMQRISFDLIHHPSGTAWSLKIMYQNGTVIETLTGNGSYANTSLNSGEYKFIFTPESNRYSIVNGSFVVNGTFIIQTINERAKAHSPAIFYLLISLIIVALISLGVVVMRRKR